MLVRPTMRRRARRRQLAAAAVLVCAGGGVASLFATGRVATVPLAVQAQVCITPPFGINCPPPSSSSSSSSSSSTSSSSHSSTARPTSGHRTPAPPPPSFAPPAGFVQPSGSALPTLPPPSPGSPPEPPDLAVQSILLQLASEPPARPGGSALVQGTLEAQRGTDTYSVPHATVAFTVTSQSGSGANIVPSELDSGDTGVVLVVVYTGDRPGDTVVHAVSGNASSDITLHTDAVRSTAKPTPGHAVAAGPVKNGPSDSHGYLVASLAALVMAVVAGYVTAMLMGQLPNPLQRRSVWGRRSETPEP